MARRQIKWLLALLLIGTATSAVLADPAGPDTLKLDDERLEPGLYPAAPGSVPPPEPAHPPFQLDWTLGLKGSYTSSSTTGGSFLTTLNPQFTAVHEGVRTDFTLRGSADIAHPVGGQTIVEIPALRLGFDSATLLDSQTRILANANLEVTRELASAPGLNPLVLAPPRVVNGTAGLAVERSFGRFNLALRGDVGRTVYGESVRTDTGITDNSHQNLWTADANLRLGFEATPIFEVFGEAGIGRDMFDVASPNLGVRTDATGTVLRGGVTGTWGSVLTATASVGVGQHNFDAAGLTDITTRLYDASVTYRPDETLALTAALSTDIEPTGADSAGTARVEHEATATLNYTVNSWLRLRASADWGYSVLEGTAETESRRGAGAGLDYVLSAHTALSADYAFAHRDNSVTGLLDTHRVTLGVTLRR